MYLQREENKDGYNAVIFYFLQKSKTSPLLTWDYGSQMFIKLLFIFFLFEIFHNLKNK